MDKKNIKRIIAREGLIILRMIIFGLLVFGLGNVVNIHFFKQCGNVQVRSSFFDLFDLSGHTLTDGAWIRAAGLGIVIFGYPIYLVICLIRCTIKTLREK
jgi:hypothetical protein